METTEPPRGTETILVVEDEEANRNLACEILRDCGYTVLSAKDGREALSVCEARKETIHLLLTDMMLPEMTGMAVAHRVLRMMPATKVLYMSGYAGAAGFLNPKGEMLTKPYSAATLAAKIREVLEGKTPRR